MAEKQLYPVFEVPDFVTKKNEESRKQQYKPSVYFDYVTGDFRLDGAGRMAGASGREAYMQWCIKTVMTERDAFLAYSTKYGAELETSLAQSDPARVEAILSAMTGRAVHVEENVAPYTIRVDIEAGGEPLDYSAVVDRLKRIKPSHIAFQLFVTADATIKVSPRSRQKVFEYKLTGEHPDVNNIGVQHPVTVRISPGSIGQAYAYPLAGEHMTGTVPDESYLAYVEGVPVKIVPTAQGTAYAYPLTGEHLAGQLPEESFIAAQGRVSAVLAGTGDGNAFPYTLAGEEPGLNNESATAKTALSLSPGGRGAAFPYSMTGEREAGTTPDINSIGAQQGTAVESSVSGRVFSFDFPLCGDDSD